MANHYVSGWQNFVGTLGLTRWVTADCGTAVPSSGSEPGEITVDCPGCLKARGRYHRARATR